MAEELSMKKDELAASFHGKHVLRNCRINTYTSKTDQWRNEVGQKDRKKRFFSDLFDDM